MTPEGVTMETRIDEIGANIYRISIFVPEDAPPAGFTYNHFLILGDEPLLFHCGRRKMFPLVSGAVGKIIPVDRLRWLTFGHFEADECGSMNEWLAAAPQSQLAHGMVGCRVSVADMADRPPRVLSDGEILDIGGKRLRYVDTPHVPHGWDAGVIFEETTHTLFCGDLFAHCGNPPALTGGDIIEPAMVAEDLFHQTSLGPTTAPTVRKLAQLKPKLLAVMHGASFSGDGAAALNALGDRYNMRLRAALDG
jgi:flavorubredoxin